MSKRAKRRAEKQLIKLLEKKQAEKQGKEEPRKREEKREHKGFFRRVYEDDYKKLLAIPMLLLLVAILQIGYQISTEGDFIHKDVSLKGGVTITVPTQEDLNINEIESFLSQKFPDATVTVRRLTTLGSVTGFIIDADISHEEREGFVSAVSEKTGKDPKEMSIEEIGSSLGSSFFRQTMMAILIAFVFMGLVVFLYFRTFVPSFAVILAAFSDIVVTVAIVNVLGMRISTAGIAAFLMLIGYSVDTDILLSTRVLKRKEGSVMQRIYSAMKTGVTMNFTTLAAVTVGMLVSKSDVLVQIMTIILIGLLVDMVNTWIQNVGILRLYLEKKGEA